MAKITENAMTVLKARYLRKGKDGNVIETPEDMFRRVAEAMSSKTHDKQRYFDRFFTVMDNLDFLPNTPTLINAGRENGQLSACFVLPIEDSMDGIFTTVKNAALIHKTGGGTGFSFSRLRPKGSRVSTTGGEASGVVSFLKVFNEATESVKQGGVRRGANMGILRVDHPDIEEFIMCKDDPSKLTNFNLSVGVTDWFMDAVKHDDYWALIDPHTRQFVKTVKAKELWDKIVHQAWKNGEPGIIFLDTINRHNPNRDLGDIEATNPCGEQPLLPYESCNLGSINLANFVLDDITIDYEQLDQIIETSVDFLNAVLDNNSFPLPKIREQTLKTRKIGLGVMGFADMLIKLHIPYNSKTAVNVANTVMSHINNHAHSYSEKRFYKNSTITTIAPTGTISMIANVSSGIEPNFSWVYTRNSCDKSFYVVHPLMEKRLKQMCRFTDDILSQLAKGVPVASIPELEGIGDEWVTAQEISPESHISIQATFQKHTDNAVSKTINLPSYATEEDVANAYSMAFSMGCKGVTVYRDGSRDNQVLNHDKDNKSDAGKKKEAPQNAPVAPQKPAVRPRPAKTYGNTTMKQIGCGKLYVTVNSDDCGLLEVFTNTGKAGGCPAQSEGLARMVSLALRYGISVAAIEKQLCGIRCMSTVRKNGTDVLSCPDAIGRALKEADEHTGRYPMKNNVNEHTGRYPMKDESTNKKCPECGGILERSEGCVICKNCGYSKCN